MKDELPAAGRRVDGLLQALEAHATIAQMVGASRETVSRTMRALAVQGVIDVSRKQIIIKQPDRLRAASPKG